MAYETGAHIGDGCLNEVSPKYCYAMYYSGNAVTDAEFFGTVIPRLLYELYGLEPYIETYTYTKSIRLRIYSKKLFEFKRDVIGLPVGNKLLMKSLPVSITRFGKEHMRQLVAGMFDTDGCFKAVRKPCHRYKLYPRVTIGIKNAFMVEVEEFLRTEGIPCHIHIDKSSGCHVLHVNGVKNVALFFEKIPSRNPKHKYRYLNWLESIRGLVAQFG